MLTLTIPVMEMDMRVVYATGGTLRVCNELGELYLTVRTSLRTTQTSFNEELIFNLEI